MNAIDIIKLACDFTGNEDLAMKLEEENPEFTNSENKTLSVMLKCLNLIQNEVATEYIPLVAFQDVTAVDFKVDYSKFDKKPISIISAKDKLGRNIRFKAFADYLMLFAGKAKIKYYYMPEEINSIQDTLSQPLLPMRIYAYGIAREYYLLQNLSDDADIWEVRFKDSLSVFARKKQDVKMPCRRWL